MKEVEAVLLCPLVSGSDPTVIFMSPLLKTIVSWGNPFIVSFSPIRFNFLLSLTSIVSEGAVPRKHLPVVIQYTFSYHLRTFKQLPHQTLG